MSHGTIAGQGYGTFAGTSQGKHVTATRLQTRGMSFAGATQLTAGKAPQGATDKLQFANHLGAAIRDGASGLMKVGTVGAVVNPLSSIGMLAGAAAFYGGKALGYETRKEGYFETYGKVAGEGFSDLGSAADNLGEAASGALDLGADLAGRVIDGILDW